MDKQNWVLIAHGGAKDIAPADEAENRAGMLQAIEAGAQLLADGGTALDAVEAVVKLLELNPAFNAGLYGGVKNEDGEIELDASIMDGSTLDIGAVAGLQNIEHPVSVARALLRDKTIFLAGAGAQKFAVAHGFVEKPSNNSDSRAASGCDTVGCVALDQSGALAVATSTGGLTGKRAGRVGDVPLPGCGFYADNQRGAVSTSGTGEAIARVMLASEFLHRLPGNAPDTAAAEALELLKRVDGEAGIISITPDGVIGWSHNSAHFAVGMAAADNKPQIYLKKSEAGE